MAMPSGGPYDPSPMPVRLEQGTVVGGCYEITSDGPFAEGTYARVYRALDQNKNRLVAVKLECLPNKEARSLLSSEAGVLQTLQNRPGIPAFIDFKESDPVAGGDILVIDLLGDDLSHLLGRVKQFSALTVGFLGLQMLRAIQSVHEKGLLHRDIKPNNFVLGPTADTRLTVYILDFGLARRHFEKDGNAKVRRARQGVCDFRGTTRYASATVHHSLDQGRVDDLWSLVYTLLELCKGHLPWSFYRSNSNLGPRAKEEAKHRVLQEKQALTILAQCQEAQATGYLRGVPAPLVDFMKALVPLKYADCPDYSHLASLLCQIGTEEERHKCAREELKLDPSRPQFPKALRPADELSKLNSKEDQPHTAPPLKSEKEKTLRITQAKVAHLAAVRKRAMVDSYCRLNTCIKRLHVIETRLADFSADCSSRNTVAKSGNSGATTVSHGTDSAAKSWGSTMGSSEQLNMTSRASPCVTNTRALPRAAPLPGGKMRMTPSIGESCELVTKSMREIS